MSFLSFFLSAFKISKSFKAIYFFFTKVDVFSKKNKSLFFLLMRILMQIIVVSKSFL